MKTLCRGVALRYSDRLKTNRGMAMFSWKNHKDVISLHHCSLLIFSVQNSTQLMGGACRG